MPEPIQPMELAAAIWRVGRSVPLNVYCGDRPVCQCHTEVDARGIVNAMNDLAASPAQPEREYRWEYAVQDPTNLNTVYSGYGQSKGQVDVVIRRFPHLKPVRRSIGPWEEVKETETT